MRAIDLCKELGKPSEKIETLLFASASSPVSLEEAKQALRDSAKPFLKLQALYEDLLSLNRKGHKAQKAHKALL